MTESPIQMEWAQRIRVAVQAEFDRVANAFSEVASRQQGQAQQETLAILEILSQIRKDTLANDSPGYYIRQWQEISSQIRQLLLRHPGYQAILAQRKARESATTSQLPIRNTESTNS